MSSSSESQRPELGGGRRKLPLLFAGLVLLTTLALSLIAGCIRRVPAPADDAPAPAPYSAVITWLDVEVPESAEAGLHSGTQPSEAGSPLPAAALRLAFAKSGRVWADSALIDGRQSAHIAEAWSEAVAMFAERQPLSEPIVTLGFDERVCALPQDLLARLIVAVGQSSYDDKGLKPRDGDRQLSGLEVDSFCPPRASRSDRSPEPGPREEGSGR